MRYHLSKPNKYSSRYGTVYICNHPVYTYCTLYLIKNKGLSVIQQRYDCNTKTTWWTEIDDWLVDILYLHDGFKDFFDKHSGLKDENGIYPTVTIRQLMWGLKIKPLKRERWETTFDHKNI